MRTHTHTHTVVYSSEQRRACPKTYKKRHKPQKGGETVPVTTNLQVRRTNPTDSATRIRHLASGAMTNPSTSAGAQEQAAKKVGRPATYTNCDDCGERIKIKGKHLHKCRPTTDGTAGPAATIGGLDARAHVAGGSEPSAEEAADAWRIALTGPVRGPTYDQAVIATGKLHKSVGILLVCSVLVTGHPLSHTFCSFPAAEEANQRQEEERRHQAVAVLNPLCIHGGYTPLGIVSGGHQPSTVETADARARGEAARRAETEHRRQQEEAALAALAQQAVIATGKPVCFMCLDRYSLVCRTL